MKIVSTGRSISSAEFHKKKRRKRRIILISVLVSILVVVAGLISLTRLNRLLVEQVSVSGEKSVDKDEIIKIVSEKIGGNYFWVIPKSNFLFLPREEIRQSLLAEFPIFKSVDLNLLDRKNLEIGVAERVAFALYCNEDSLEGLPDCYLLDKSGFIYDRSPGYLGAVYFIYSSGENLSEPIGKQFILEEEFKKLPEFIDNLSVLGINPVALKISDSEYKLTILNGGYIVWKRQDDLSLVRSNLEAFLFSDAIRSQVNFMNNILYLDLRTDNKIFYKFKGEDL